MVSLIGEAYFEVAKDKEKPFIVETAGMNVEALGTTFNVKAYREDSQIIATLFSGSVRVSSDRDNVILSPDENATFERRSGKLAIHKPDNSSYAKMWRNNDLVFNGDFNKWVKFANSLRLRLAMRLAFVKPEVAKEQAEKAISHSLGVITSNDDNAGV